MLAVREDETTHTLRIIDGQQRLTTVLLVLDCLDGGNRSSKLIEYEMRNTTEGKTLDGYFKSGARKEIDDWLSQKTETQKSEFSQKLIDCEFLYFTIESKDSEFDFFSRLNTWKISATDAELVKCFFLSNDDSAEVVHTTYDSSSFHISSLLLMLQITLLVSVSKGEIYAEN